MLVPDTARAPQPAADATTSAPTAGRPRVGRLALGLLGRILLVAVVAFAIGGLTPLGQAALPDALASLANSVGGWLIPTAALVFLFARGTIEAAVEGALAFVAMTMGYAVVSTMRGDVFDPSVWAFIGVFAGPVVGLAALGVRRRGITAAIGAAVLGGILVGEGAYGLTVIVDTTSPTWWFIEIAVGVAIVVAVSIRMRRAGLIAVAVLGMAAIGLVFWAAFTLLPVLLVL